MKVNDQMLADGKNQIKHAFGNYCDIHEKKKNNDELEFLIEN